MTGTIGEIPSIGQADGQGWLRSRREEVPESAVFTLSQREHPPSPGALSSATYAELHCHTCYSFREGASSPRELAERAAALGYQALAVTDRDGLYGAMEFAKAARAAGVRPIIGADVTLQGRYRLVLLAATREGYANLSRLITHARLAEAQPMSGPPSGVSRQRAGRPSPASRGGGSVAPGPALTPALSQRGRWAVELPAPSPQLHQAHDSALGTSFVRPEIPDPQIPMHVLAQHTEGLIALSGDEHGEVPSLVAAGQMERARAAAARYARWFGRENFFLELQETLTLGDAARNRGLAMIAQDLGLGIVATNDVWYHVQDRHRLHDVLVAIKHRTTLDASHQLRHANGERYLKSTAELAELFAAYPEALVTNVRIAERCQFDLVEDLGYEFPHYPVPPGETTDSYLERVCREALSRKYGGGAREKGDRSGGSLPPALASARGGSALRGEVVERAAPVYPPEPRPAGIMLLSPHPLEEDLPRGEAPLIPGRFPTGSGRIASTAAGLWSTPHPGSRRLEEVSCHATSRSPASEDYRVAHLGGYRPHPEGGGARDAPCSSVMSGVLAEHPSPQPSPRWGDGASLMPLRLLSTRDPEPSIWSAVIAQDSGPSTQYCLAVERLEEELGLIRRHGLAGFFLAYYDLLKLAGEIAAELKGRDPTLPPDERPVGRGRGSSVSSIVCYLIGLSHVDPIANELFLGRFLNEEMHSVPDIDLDFPRDIREELLKRIWTAFDEGRAALVCAYSTWHGRSAVRDVGKALGLPLLEIDHLAKLSDSWSSEGVAREMARLPEYQDKLNAPLWKDLVAISQQIIGLPRHVTQHVGGVVLAAQPLMELVPLEPTRMAGRVMCQWDKDSVDDARMVKIDFLALGMLSLVDECLDTIEQRHGQRPDLGRIPHDDPEIYDRICAGDTVGLFQIESRAQIATLPHTQPRNLDDLAVQVAIVRPGPIVGGAFRPYMEYRRRLREGEPVDVQYIDPCLEPVLKDTLGVVLYQEQVVQVAMAMAKYSAGEADQLRRNLSRRRGGELVEKDWPAFRDQARANGISEDAAQAAFRSILGFASYGFPKSHAVAFGLLAYESAWLRYRYPAEYYAALFNNQPMGFYTTEVIAGDARRHGIELARPDVNLSEVGCVAETDRRIRLGLAEVKGVGTASAELLVAEREVNGPYFSLQDCMERTGLRPEAYEHLVMAGAWDGPLPWPPPALGGGDRVSPPGRGRRGEAEPSEGRAPYIGQTNIGGNDPSPPPGERTRRGLPPLPVSPRSDSRREMLWEVGLLAAQPGKRRRTRNPASSRQLALPLPVEQDLVELPPMSGWEQVAAEYEILGLSPDHQAMALLRKGLDPDLVTSAQAAQLPDGTEVRVAGLVVCRQRPSTAKGVLFVSLEDEYGIANLVVWARLFERQRTLILTQPFLIVRAAVQRQGPVVHLIARDFERPNVRTDRLIVVSHDFH